MSDVYEHAISRTLKETVIVPDHVKRTESTEFRRAKQRLKEDGHYKCWVCGSIEKLQVHHFGIEWSLANIADWDKVKSFCEEWDPYGYGRLLRNVPICLCFVKSIILGLIMKTAEAEPGSTKLHFQYG